MNVHNNSIDSYLHTDRSATVADNTRRWFEQDVLGTDIKQVITTPQDFTEDKSLQSSRVNGQLPAAAAGSSAVRYPWEVPTIEPVQPAAK